jgi:hypothetical protein
MTPFNLYAFDLSSILLNTGVWEIAKYLDSPGTNATPELRENLLHIYGVCIDFKDFDSTLKFKLENDTKFNLNDKTISFGRSRCLFHLLGLTLANNKEIELLDAIYQIMGSNDYLLLGVDFCIDGGPVSIEKAEKIYSQSEATNDINQFMCNSLHLASNYKSTDKTEYNGEFRDTFCYAPFYSDNIRIIHEQESTEHSNVSSAISFVRRIQVGAHVPRLCDYSSKYSRQHFESFIKEHTHFNWVHHFQILEKSENTQALVLLRKEDKMPSNDKKITEAIEELENIKATDEAQCKTHIIDEMIAFLRKTQNGELADVINKKNLLM